MIKLITLGFSLFTSCYFLAFSNIPETSIPKIELRSWGIIENSYYQTYEYPKSVFAPSFPKGGIDNFPNHLLVFEYSPSTDQEKELQECLDSIRQKRHSYKEACLENDKQYTVEGFKRCWKRGLRACHLKYLETGPEMYFNFNNIGARTMILDSVKVFIYTATNNYSGEEMYLSNFTKKYQEIVIDTDQIHKEQAKKLEEPFNTSEYSFKKRFKLLSEEYWNGDFSKNRFIIQLRFPFIDGKNGQEELVVTDPFVIDL